MRPIDADLVQNEVAKILQMVSEFGHGDGLRAVFYANASSVLNMVAEKIDDIPTINTDRHAHWNNAYRSGYIPKDGSLMCSDCDCWSERRSDYRPNCGAIMEEDDSGRR